MDTIHFLMVYRKDISSTNGIIIYCRYSKTHSIRLNSSTSPLNMMAAHVPTVNSRPKRPLDSCGTQKTSTQVGTGHYIWRRRIGNNGVGKLNDNARDYWNYAAPETFALHKHRISWVHPASHQCHRMDLIIVGIINPTPSCSQHTYLPKCRL